MTLWTEETRYNPLCDVDEESSSDMLSDELNNDYDNEIYLEIEGEPPVKNEATKCRKVRVRAKQVLLHVGGWKT
jgi:hypothetical protein